MMMAERVDQIRVKALTTFLQDMPEVLSLRGLKTVGLSDQSWVLSAHINGTKMVIKKFFKSDRKLKIQNLRQELDYLEGVFGESNCQANKCLMAWPDAGIAVLSFAPGQRLDHKISASMGLQRRQLLTHSGAWLKRYIQPRQRPNSFAPAFWINKLQSLTTSHVLDPVETGLLRQLMDALTGQTDTLRGCTVTQAATHSDFVGMNAHYHKKVIYGFDIQGESWLPVAKDAARFLVWLQIHDETRPTQCQFGIEQSDWDAFLASGVISESEQTTTLPFFIGAQLYERFVENYHRRAIRQNTHAAIVRYLAN